jgi:hypothetical protein
MKIKEKYYENRIIHLLREYNENFGLLNESKKEIIMDKLGIREELAQVFDEICGKLSAWIANKYLKYYYDDNKTMSEPGVPHKDILDWAKHRMNTTPTWYLRRDLPGIMDYILIGLNRDKSSLEDLPMFEIKRGEPNIYNKSKEWHDSLAIGDGAINYIENARKIIDFRDENGEGYYWADLNVKNSNEECERMGHCGRSSYGFLYSLRSYKNIPGTKFKTNRSHLTAAIGTDGILYQLKGPKNSKPKEEYHKYIEPLFYALNENEEDYLIQGFGTEYGAEQDFKLSDLPETTIRKIYQDRPELFNTRGLKRKLGEMGIIDVQPLQTRFVLEIDPDKIGDYLEGNNYTYRTHKYKNSEGKQVIKKIGYYELIMSDSVWEIADEQNWSSDWKFTLNHYVDSNNKKLIESIIDEWISKSGDEVDEDMDLEDKIKKYDDNDDIRIAIGGAENEVASKQYVDYLRDVLKTALEEYGSVFEFSTETIKIQIDLKDFTNIDEDTLDEYYESYGDNPRRIFKELLGHEYIDKPKPIFTNFDNFLNIKKDKDLYNSYLSNMLNSI